MAFTIQTPEQLSAHLVAMREQAQLTQAELGLMLGVHQPRVAKIENDPLSISVGKLLQILGLLNASITLHQKEKQTFKVSDPARRRTRESFLIPTSAAAGVPAARVASGKAVNPSLNHDEAKSAKHAVSSAHSQVRDGRVIENYVTKGKLVATSARAGEILARRQVLRDTASKASNKNVRKSAKGDW